MLCFGGGGGTHKVLNGEAPCRRPTPLPFSYTICGRQGTTFVYLPLTNGTPFTYQVNNSAFLLTAVNTLFFK